MKPVLEDISLQLLQSSFLAYSFQASSFEFKWHFHPEYELTFIVKGNGYRLIGNSHEDFSENDLVLIGPNLPHTWVGKAYNEENVEAIVIQFSKDFANKILGLEENRSLASLLNNSGQGLFFNQWPEGIESQLFDIIRAEGMDKIVRFMVVLSRLSQLEATPLSSPSFRYAINQQYETRIDKVCLFLQHNFQNEVNLKQVADLVFMTESNFCKFFKKALGTTFSNYLNELRINEACQFLLHSDETINQIAYKCGFESLSYFNRVFLKKKQTTPSQMRAKNLNKA